MSRIKITLLSSKPGEHDPETIKLLFRANLTTKGGIISYVEQYIVTEAELRISGLKEIKLRFLNMCLEKCDEIILKWKYQTHEMNNKVSTI